LKREIERLKAHLPIYARRLDLIFTIASSRVVILKADTGSGKSTQLVQYLVDAGLANQGLFISTLGFIFDTVLYLILGQIVCAQPRRLAASALALRVAEEFGCEVGDEVNQFPH
jgi:HrpA-like RNA helicase